MEEWSIWTLVLLGILGWVLIWHYVHQNMEKKMKRRSGLFHNTLPPSPPGTLPFLGHLHKLLLSRQTPHRWFDDMSTRYGPILSLQIGCVPTLVVSSPEMAAQVLHTHDLVFASRSPSSSAASRFTYNCSGLGHTPYGPLWRKVKELYMTKLFNTQRLQHFKPIRGEEIRGLVHSVWQDIPKSEQDMRLKLQVRACNIISRMALGKNFDDLSVITNVSGLELVGAIRESLDLISISNIGDFLPALKFLDIQRVQRRTNDTFETLDTIFQRIVDNRRDSHANIGGGSYGENDLLDTLLSLHEDKGHISKANSLTDDNIKAILWDIFAGGIDTSSIAVEWGLAELIRHQDITRRLQDELDHVIGKDRLISEEDIPNLPYLQATVKETMRSHPVLPLLIPHESIQPCEVAGFYVPEKTRLIVNAWSLSMDENSWEKPMEFRPQRFVDSSVDLKGHHFQFLPFGAGRRACPAMNLGLLNVYLMLGSLIHCFEWSLPPGIEEMDMSESFGITLHKTNPLVSVASPRLSRELYSSLIINS